MGAVEKIVTERSGNQDDVIFIQHHTLVAFMKQALQNRALSIETNIYSYLNGIAKYMWLGELRKKKRISEKEVALEYENHEMTDGSHQLQFLQNERNKILEKVLDSIGEKCKEVLSMWSAGYSMKEIASMTGYKSEGVVRKKKFQCMNALSKYLNDNPDQKEMLR